MILQILKYRLIQCLHFILSLLPVSKNKIVFANFLGRGMGGSPKYIAEEMLRQALPYDMVWLVSDTNEKFPSGIRPVKMFSIRGRYELATARVIINNVKHKLPFKKKNTQFYIQTWHGDFALKYIEKEVEDRLNPGYAAESKADSRETDLILSGSHQFTDIVKSSFWYDGEIFECGVPSNDPFFVHDGFLTKKVRNHFGISEAAGIILYAPTFRDGDNSVFDIPDFDAIVNRLKEITGKTWVLLVRFHPLDQQQLARVKFNDNVVNGSSYPGTQDLSKAADLVITDYSSLISDFLLQRKMGVLFVPDVERYEQTRGLRPIFWEVPYPIVRTQKELIQHLEDLFQVESATKRESFLKDKINSFDDGHASERVVERVQRVISGR